MIKTVMCHEARVCQQWLDCESTAKSTDRQRFGRTGAVMTRDVAKAVPVERLKTTWC